MSNQRLKTERPCLQTIKVLRIFSSCFSVQEISGASKRIYQIRIDGEVNHTFFHVNYDISTYYPWHGCPVLSAFCSCLYIGAFSGRSDVEFRIIAGINVVLIALVIIFRKQLIISPMVNFLANLFLTDSNK